MTDIVEEKIEESAMPETPADQEQAQTADRLLPSFYKIQFRPEEQKVSAVSKLNNLQIDEAVMVQTDHGLEPAAITNCLHSMFAGLGLRENAIPNIVRRCTMDEVTKYQKLGDMEKSAFEVCSQQIARHKLPMRLTRVERYFNGSKIIFYFTAENRVDFRELVKSLVQEFRTRVEMRQIGVRHETKMLGGVGCCGRELCCASFIKNFESVSIKMAKEQNLPLNPLKISGACNRLLCCLNYEFSTYKSIRKAMPKVGKRITIDSRSFKVIRHNVLNETIVVVDDKEELVLNKSEWRGAKIDPPPKK